MVRARVKFRLHRTAIVLICLALLVILMQGASYFSLSHQMARSEQVEELARTLTSQVAYSLSPLMESADDNSLKINNILKQLTDHSRILDAGIYQQDGSLIARAGEQVQLRDRLALDGNRVGSYFNYQLVQPIEGKDGPIGFLRITLDTHVLETEAKQVDNTTNILRLMILLSLAIGIILTRTLLQNRRTRWQQSPYLLTASTPVKEDDGEDTEKENPGKP
ncbi:MULTISPECIES: YtjB family periplasmic protein [unclassified Brenneria]|uniref:YtjB family periplasmic protein n=1 Tax=unclassified Brenneria TaxID=2634434 RepID=UPI0015578DD6|nr:MULTISPECIES: YtjB family periplasmic protein [unclassified Brenneria]MBJ7222354.1 YtjB family periplasmic protein [Brenneria sp. L3-3C-1]MEE3643597.1 YtjB family periplasmic protein [Brenneria sp. L3_3C_1]MEE3651307.1 YtjB family periplasmic protein [Brenneria sp. HEZEL_4_2_4]NPD01262.1 YtjB family periplasmic protein [Brenneria sp. hezel4-2-4]